jgi:hypothetical protein
MVKKCKLLTFFVFLSLILTFCSSESGDMSGKYVSTENPRKYIELKKDGTYHLESLGWSSEGGWKVEGNTLILSLPDNRTVKGNIKGGKIRGIMNGDTWIKEK